MAEEFSDIWQDPAEAVAELLLEKGLDRAAPALSQIPLLSFVIAAYKSKGAISDYLLAKKVQTFYTAWDDLPEAERRSVYQKFQKKPKAFIEKLLFMLAQQEDLQKCRLLGVLTTSYLRGQLKRNEYLECIETVARLSLRDLLCLASLNEYGPLIPMHKLGERYASIFISRGLLVSEPDLPIEQRGEHPYHRVTKLGEVFMKQIVMGKLQEVV